MSPKDSVQYNNDTQTDGSVSTDAAAIVVPLSKVTRQSCYLQFLPVTLNDYEKVDK